MKSKIIFFTTTTGAGGPRQPQKNKVRQTMNGVEIQQNNMRDEKQQQNGSENVPPAPTRGETKQSKEPEKFETVSKGTGGNGTGASKYFIIFSISRENFFFNFFREISRENYFLKNFSVKSFL